MLITLAAWLLRKRGKKLGARVGAAAFVLLAGFTASIGGYLAWWYTGRAEPLDREILRGVRHVRVVLEEPRHVVVNLVFLNLKDRGLRLEVTPADPDIRPKV